MTTPPNYPEQLLAQTDWLERLARELVPRGHSADLAQETLVAELERPEPKQASLRTWLERIARNLAAGGFRARDRRLRRERRTARAEAEPSTVETIAQFEVHRSVIDAVQRLREPMRSTLLLRFWEDLPPREIGKRMQVPVETVRTRIKRACQELRGTLDGQHGHRQAWCAPLLSLSMARGAAVANGGLTVSAVGILMQTKTVAITAIAVLGTVGAFVWSAGSDPQPEVDASTEADQVAGMSAGQTSTPTTPSGQAVAPSESDDVGGRALEPRSRTPVLLGPQSPNGWFEGSVTDELSRPLVDVEVAFLTETEANEFREHDLRELGHKDRSIAQTRWTLWHISNQGWMQDDALLGKVFNVPLVTRTGLDGGFRFRERAVQGRAVFALWYPTLGLRFHPVAALATPGHIVCERWPRIRGRVTLDSGDLTEPLETKVDYGKRGGRVLQFRTTASGHYMTPQIPPGNHTVRFESKDHFVGTVPVDLIEDATINAELVSFPVADIRLVDAGGLLWDGARVASMGWTPEDLQFVLVREEFSIKTDLEADLGIRSELRYAKNLGTVKGVVKDVEALVLSVWQGSAWVASVRLPDHGIQEVAMQLSTPRLATTLDVDVVLGGSTQNAPMVELELGTMGGVGRYNFSPASTETQESGRFQLEVPGFFRGQKGHLIATAAGFAQQMVEVSIPMQGTPDAVRITMPSANQTLFGRVVDQDGQPIVRARLTLAAADGGVLRSLRKSIGKTDEAGEFRFPNLSDANVRVFANRQGFAGSSVLTGVDSDVPVTIRLVPGTERSFNISEAEGEGYMLRVRDVQGAPLLDDRVFGAVHGGALRLRLSLEAHTLEAWIPGAATPTRTFDLQ